jgi:hypothetical protein
MKRYLILLTCLIFSTAAAAEEIDGEVNISVLNEPYLDDFRIAPGFCVSWRPDFLQRDRWSLGAGASLSIASQFQYATSGLDTIDSLNAPSLPERWGWLFFNEYFMEVTHPDFFLEGRYRLLGMEEDRWKGWITLTLGEALSSAAVLRQQTQFDADDENAPVFRIPRNFESQTRWEPYLSPGIMVGIKNFIIGYRHWIYFQKLDLEDKYPPGQLEEPYPPRLLGTLRVGYRFTW